MSATRPRPPAGLTLVELLVGLAVGLFVVSTAIGLLTSHLQENRALIVETRLMHELRSAADRVTRDLRRAGYWGDATAALWQPDAPQRANPYLAFSPVAAASAASFRYSRDASENHAVDGNEQFGYRLRNGNLEILLGGSWQMLTDPATLVVTGFSVSPQSHDEPLERLCSRPCPAEGAVDCPPRLQVRRLDLSISGRSAIDPRVVRSIRSSVRLRNDALVGACPD